MNTSIKKLIYSMSICCIFCACNNDLEESSKQLNTPKETTMSFIYDGKLYMSQCLETEDTTIILDNSTKSIADKLSTLPRLTTIVSPDPEKPIMYFDTPEDADIYFNWTGDTSSNDVTKAVTFLNIKLTLFEDKDYCGWAITNQIPYNSIVEVPGLGGKNEKISSLQIRLDAGSNYPGETSDIVGAVKLFDNKNYQGSSIYFFASTRTYMISIPNLKNYALYPGSKRNWGDKTCSYKAGYKKVSELPNW